MCFFFLEESYLGRDFFGVVDAVVVAVFVTTGISEVKVMPVSGALETGMLKVIGTIEWPVIIKSAMSFNTSVRMIIAMP